MPWSQYDINLCSPIGVPVAVIDDASTLEYARAVNTVGACTLIIPYTDRRWSLACTDAILNIWRRDDLGTRRRPMDTLWLLRKRKKSLGADGSLVMVLTFVDLMEVLTRRMIAYPELSARANRTGPVDDVIRQIVRDNYTDIDYTDPYCLHQPGGNLGTWMNVESDAGAGATVLDASPFGNVLSTIQALAQSVWVTSRQYVAFDFEVQSLLSLDFRVYMGARGTDRTQKGSKPLTLSPESGTLGIVDYEEDWSTAATWVIVCGAGTGVDQVFGTCAVAGSPNSPFGAIEYLETATTTSDDSALVQVATAAARQQRPTAQFTASIQQSAGFLYGRDFEFGDKLTVHFGQQALTARLDGLHVTVTGQDGAEQFDGTFQAELYEDIPGGW